MTDEERLAQIQDEQRALLRSARRGSLGAAPTTYAPARWAHVPLCSLLREFGYTLYKKNDREYETAHQAHAQSRSGRNMVVWPAEGRAYCRKCGRVYDAVALVSEHQGTSPASAAQWLRQRYGAPPSRSPRRAAPGVRSISWTVQR